MKRILKLNGTFVGLLVTLVVLMVLPPMFRGILEDRVYIDGIFTIVFFAVIVGLVANTKYFLSVLFLGVPSIVCRWVSYAVGEYGTLLLFSELMDFIFLIFAATLIVWHVMQVKDVGVDTLAGAISAFLLIGVAFSRLYAGIETVEPGSFKFPDPAMADWTIDQQGPVFLYYSLVVLTTLGFGDMVPLNGVARSVTVIEAVAGQMFIAILVARLVGMTISRVANDGIADDGVDE